MTGPFARELTLACGQRLPNRIAKAALTEGLADDRNRVTSAHLAVYRRWSMGGAGLLITGNVMVDARWLERPGNLVLGPATPAEDLDGFRALAQAGTAGGNALFMQLNHPGRQTNRFVSTTPVAPSASGAVSLFGFFSPPRALQVAEIESTIDAFADAAAHAKTCGFSGVQIHAAHGYLLSQFLSPLVNQRTDTWGGSLENRARALLEVVRRTRARVGATFPIAVKLNSADFQCGGFDQDESMRVVEMLEAQGVDLLEISGGNYESMALFGLAEGQADVRKASTKAREAYFLTYAEQVRARTKLPIMVTGGFRTPAAMRDALHSGSADVIGLGRPLIVDPELPGKLMSGAAQVSSAGAIKTGIRSLDGMAEAGWYARQILRLGEGKEPDPALGALSSALIYAARDMRRALAWRRAHRR